MTKLTDGEMAIQFIEDNGLTYKFILWQELFLEPQVMNADVNVEAEDVTYYESTLTQEELNQLLGEGGTSGKSNVNYGIIEQLPDDPTRV